jgi:hypothetical protein
MRRLLSALVALATLAVPASAQLAGTYTVGGVSPDYATLAAAVSDLETLGVSGDAIFQIRPGTYSGGIDLGAIPGVSSTARVRFEAEDPVNPPTLQRPFAGAATNYVVRLDGADWVTLKDLDLVAAAPSPTGRLIVLTDEASNVTVRGCTLTGHVAPGSDEGSLIWSDGTQTLDGFTLDQSTLTYGYRGIDLRLFSSSTGIVVSDNTFKEQDREAVYLVGTGTGRIEGNEVADGPSSNPTYTGLRTGGAAVDVVGNTIDVGNAPSGSGISANQGTVLLANNVVSMRGSTTSFARAVYVASGTLVVHNTIRAQGDAAALEIGFGDGPTVEVRNNILAVDGEGAVLEDNGSSSIVASDHNVLYTSAGTLVEWEGTTYTTFADWQAASGFDGASVSQTTDFVSVSPTGPWDLHLDGASLTDLSLIAPPVVGVTADVDGDARDPYNPKRGADEGTPLPPFDDADIVAGFYTVGGTAPDFAEVDEMLEHLAARGMKGPATFRIRAGTYANVRESLQRTIRVGPAETDPAATPLTLRAANPANPPTLVSGATASFNWSLRLRGLDHVTLRHLIFDATATGDAGRILVLNAGADGEGVDDLTVDECTFEGTVYGTDTEERTLVYSEDSFHDRLAITGSTFRGGRTGIGLVEPFSSNPSLDTQITGNLFEDQLVYALWLGDADGILIEGNTFTSVEYPTAIQLGFVDGYTITGNEVRYLHPLSAGIFLNGPDADGSGTALVANNLVRAGRPLVASTSADGARVIHNTFYASGTVGVPVTTAGSDLAELVNNILYSASGAPALVLDEADDLGVSDGNVLWTVGSGPLVDEEGTAYADLAAWQATGRDARSRAFAPAFADAGAGDLRLGTASDGDPRLAGLAGTGVGTDVDGQGRSADNPYIGGDERSALLPLSGDLYVGVAPSGFPAADYPTLAEAADALFYLGVAGAATFRLYDDVGPFPVTLRAYDGASAADPLVIVPVNAGVTYVHAGTDEASAGAIRVDGASHLLLTDFGLDVSGGTGAHGHAIRFEGDVGNVTLQRMGLVGISDATVTGASLVWANGGSLTDVVIRDGQTTGGSRGVLLSASSATGTVIDGLRVIDPAVDGISLSGHADPLVEAVEVHAEVSLLPTAYGVLLTDGTGGEIRDSRITMADPSGIGVSLAGQSASAGLMADPVSIVNTFVTSGGTGIALARAGGVRIAHTSVRSEGGAGALHEAGFSEDVTLVNSLLVHAGGGPVLDLSSAGAITASDFNGFSTGGPTLATVDGVGYADLAAYRTATGLDANSTAPTVAFVDGPGGDLHLAGASEGDPALRGTPLADVTTDIDGDDRSATDPYMGADEGVTPLPPATPPYAVTAPAVLGAYAHGDVLNVEWTTLDPTFESGDVRVSVLCPGEAPFVRYAATANDGKVGFVVPVSLGVHGGVDDQAGGCTVEVASAATPSRAAESAPFVVTADGVAGVTTRKLDLSTPRSPARYGLQDIVKWFWDEASVPTGTVRLALVCDGRERWVRYADTENDGQASARLPAVFGAYPVCRAEVTSLADPAFFGRSGPFEVLDTRLPSVDVLAPAPDDVIPMGTDLDVVWETESIGAGADVKILLVDLTNGPPNRLLARTTNTGLFTWSVPTDLDPAAEYRLSVKATPADGTLVSALVDPLTFTAPGSRSASASASAEAAPEALTVGATRPNPARGRATVRVGVPEAGPVEVVVYDAVGRRVAELAAGERAPGWHELAVEAGALAPGVYVVRALAPGAVATRTLTVVR